MNSSVLNGEKILGNKILMSAPSSFISKKLSFKLLPSLEEPIEPKAEICRVSAPLKTFLIKIELLVDRPIDWMLLWETLKSNPSAYLSFGISSMLAIRDLFSVSSTYSILGYLKVWSWFKYLYVLRRSFSLNILLGFISIELIIVLGLNFSFLS